MDEEHLKVYTSQIGKVVGEAYAQTMKGSESSVTKFTPEMLLQQNLTLMEEILGKENLKLAYKAVIKNKGCAGIDGMNVWQLKEYLIDHWSVIKQQLLDGSYKPKPTKRVEIPKPSGKGNRMLSIPTVLDRFIGQATLQILQGYIDASFSDNSYGFRPKRSAKDAIEKGKQYVSEGYNIVVDIDLEKFFDTLNHDKLMSELYKRIKDVRVLKLIRSYLNSGAMIDGMFIETGSGAAQGSSLSPFLSNIMLDLLDKELEARGHKHVRYADDCNIYVKTQKAGERVMKSITDFITRKLKLKVNKAKSKVDKVEKRKFLGFSLLTMKLKDGSEIVKIGISPESLTKLKERVRAITSKNRGISMSVMLKQLSTYLTGWNSYYRIIETPTVLKGLDGWIRRRVRCYKLKQWKKCAKRVKGLVKMGVPSSVARTLNSSKGLWRLSHCHAIQMAMDIAYFKNIGLKFLYEGKVR
jgi:group II intron reverse transcriptase/maturase